MLITPSELCQELPPWGHIIFWALVLGWEYWLGKTKLVKSGSTLEMILNILRRKKDEGKMEVAKGVKVDLEKGDIVVRISVVGEVEKLEQKFISGEIDLIKGTDLDKDAALIVLGNLKKALGAP